MQPCAESIGIHYQGCLDWMIYKKFINRNWIIVVDSLKSKFKEFVLNLPSQYHEEFELVLKHIEDVDFYSIKFDIFHKINAVIFKHSPDPNDNALSSSFLRNPQFIAKLHEIMYVWQKNYLHVADSLHILNRIKDFQIPALEKLSLCLRQQKNILEAKMLSLKYTMEKLDCQYQNCKNIFGIKTLDKFSDRRYLEIQLKDYFDEIQNMCLGNEVNDALKLYKGFSERISGMVIENQVEFPILHSVRSSNSIFEKFMDHKEEQNLNSKKHLLFSEYANNGLDAELDEILSFLRHLFTGLEDDVFLIQSKLEFHRLDISNHRIIEIIQYLKSISEFLRSKEYKLHLRILSNLSYYEGLAKFSNQLKSSLVRNKLACNKISSRIILLSRDIANLDENIKRKERQLNHLKKGLADDLQNVFLPFKVHLLGL